MAYFGNGRRHRAYREKAQNYSEETSSIWENVKFGFVYGSQSFIDHIKEKHLSDKPDKELPQLNRFLRSQNPDNILKKAKDLLSCKVDDFKKARRLTGTGWRYLARHQDNLRHSPQRDSKPLMWKKAKCF